MGSFEKQSVLIKPDSRGNMGAKPMIPRKVAATVALALLSPAISWGKPAPLAPEDRATLEAYARDTWRSIEAITAGVDLPPDELRREGDRWLPAGLTSPSNIAAYLWSTLAAENLKLITRDESNRRLLGTLAALSRMERAHGFYYNWYDPVTGEKSLTWPGGGVVRPFLSSVDNGWLAAALVLIHNLRPELREAVSPLLDPMDFAFFYTPYNASDPVGQPGLLRGGFWGDSQTYTEFHYGMLNTEPRIASYIGIARGQLPVEHYYRLHRACNTSGAPTRTYAGIPVIQGTQEIQGGRLVPTWDGTMFEALMVTLFVPEAEWAPESWGVNHPLYVKAQIEHGKRISQHGFWGVSASCDPNGGYQAFGVPELGAWTRVNAMPERREGVVTPHASMLALRFAPAEALANLRGMQTQYPIYSQNGFADSVDVASGRVSDRVLVLDQGMILAAIVNVLNDDMLVHAFSDGVIETSIRPLISLERFGSGTTVESEPKEDHHVVPMPPAVASEVAASADADRKVGADLSTDPGPSLSLVAIETETVAETPAEVELGALAPRSLQTPAASLKATIDPRPTQVPKRRGRVRVKRRGRPLKIRKLSKLARDFPAEAQAVWPDASEQVA